MNKVALTSLGAAGAAGTAVGGGMLAKSYHNANSFTRKKYKHAMLRLDSDAAIWDSKYAILKSSKDTPKNSTLSLALAKSKDGEESKAKELLRQGCEEVYNSHEEEKYFEDFKKFCAKTNKDVSSRTTWITGNDKSDSWNAPLGTLKDYSGDLEPYLLSVKNSLRKENNGYQDAEREWIKGWCEDTQQELFDGTMGSTKLSNQDTFCTSNQQQ
ncbi:hypothetical protein HF1_05000 [Mycoplasma haemofelis str. Langford 1]|uniref:Uncharacterized protein n=2 Tax=Mycoplasma haemofelis TaxID=29501 RepID=F6FHX1_MYCHI|nr:hypothetical protein [Mycoplasma haemofelis]AEG72819.1 hypothetical protein MHF_0547 [Mycoplasma haemofelis Ohio2]CBY92508.1 hypothetical protein HF1_05000 [Mycoplasma haemofelis str. Langford 1]